ncbi:hypothetical protein BDK51DRAFT_28482 [Blyttiomyces helicus]|uniref:Uncharacterized protein n=1 Tax=Blyttiomyces helicus TaxID=388810 RepID=A0A4P9W217_9FUNG|nr:hypothetical protein BDK51DRAFT_28482 [Blyttiomyces helicus]|eukprot:RKO85752.1 hypothetical protein BDK51DRAFT_28482 [Blyttiomyces helicus]
MDDTDQLPQAPPDQPDQPDPQTPAVPALTLLILDRQLQLKQIELDILRERRALLAATPQTPAADPAAAALPPQPPALPTLFLPPSAAVPQPHDAALSFLFNDFGWTPDPPLSAAAGFLDSLTVPAAEVISGAGWIDGGAELLGEWEPLGNVDEELSLMFADAFPDTNSSPDPAPAPAPFDPLPPPPPSHPPAPEMAVQPTTPGASKQKLRAPRRETAEETAKCNCCGTTVAILLLHGTTAELSTPHTYLIVCSYCNPPDTSPAAHSKKRASPRGSGNVDCAVCSKRLGRGGMALTVEERLRGDWTETPFAVEPICPSCRQKYQRCTACGAGGTFRSGRWRPKELFNVEFIRTYERLMGVLDAVWEQAREFLVGSPPVGVERFVTMQWKDVVVAGSDAVATAPSSPISTDDAGTDDDDDDVDDEIPLPPLPPPSAYLLAFASASWRPHLGALIFIFGGSRDNTLPGHWSSIRSYLHMVLHVQREARHRRRINPSARDDLHHISLFTRKLGPGGQERGELETALFRLGLTRIESFVQQNQDVCVEQLLSEFPAITADDGNAGYMANVDDFLRGCRAALASKV